MVYEDVFAQEDSLKSMVAGTLRQILAFKSRILENQNVDKHPLHTKFEEVEGSYYFFLHQSDPDIEQWLSLAQG